MYYFYSEYFKDSKKLLALKFLFVLLYGPVYVLVKFVRLLRSLGLWVSSNLESLGSIISSNYYFLLPFLFPFLLRLYLLGWYCLKGH